MSTPPGTQLAMCLAALGALAAGSTLAQQVKPPPNAHPLRWYERLFQIEPNRFDCNRNLVPDECDIGYPPPRSPLDWRPEYDRRPPTVPFSGAEAGDTTMILKWDEPLIEPERDDIVFPPRAEPDAEKVLDSLK